MIQTMAQRFAQDILQPGSRRTIPFDYAFRYELSGEVGNILNNTVTVSVEAPFVAVSIGYGVIPKVTPITFGPPSTIFDENPPPLQDLILRQLFFDIDSTLAATTATLKSETAPEVVFKNGFKLNPEFAEFVLTLGDNNLPADIVENLFQVVGAPPEQIQFLYAIFDEGTGRAFQSEPILNTAGLGISNGDRPFRYFAKPINFAPRSNIRMEVTEVSDFKGELHISLHGYKILGGAGTPTDIRRDTVRMRRR